MKARILWIVFLVSIFGFTGCNDKGGNGRGPGGPDISSVTANPGTIEVNGSSTLTCVASHPERYPRVTFENQIQCLTWQLFSPAKLNKL